jgi:hypothetical protein
LPLFRDFRILGESQIEDDRKVIGENDLGGRDSPELLNGATVTD